MDGRTDAQKTNVALATLAMLGSDVASLVESRPVVLEEIARRTDGRTTDALTDGRTEK